MLHFVNSSYTWLVNWDWKNALLLQLKAAYAIITVNCPPELWREMISSVDLVFFFISCYKWWKRKKLIFTMYKYNLLHQYHFLYHVDCFGFHYYVDHLNFHQNSESWQKIKLFVRRWHFQKIMKNDFDWRKYRSWVVWSRIFTFIK